MQVFARRLVVLTATVAIAAGLAPAAALAAQGSGGPPRAHPVIRTQRLCSTPRRGYLTCYAIRQVTPREPAALRAAATRANPVTPAVTPSGYGPSDLRSAYNLTGTGSAAETVAIVDAQDDPNAESDLAVYRAQYGLPACTTANGCFRKVNQQGQASPLPSPDTGWAGEISLDLDMVSAICPDCHILLVEASSPTIQDLGTAVNTAASLGAQFISNSYGGSEDGGENGYDTSYYKHPGVAITASTGDSGYGISYPASSAYVTAVGGTSLGPNSSARGWGETAWSGGGSGCSFDVAQPSFQQGVTTGCSKRSAADVAAVADPATGVAVYNTYGDAGWNVYGGTSVSSPVVAGVYALGGIPKAGSYPNTAPYADPGGLNDVTRGSNGSCSPAVQCTAGPGYDGPTGLGTPNGTAAFGQVSPPPLAVTNPGGQSATVGTAFSLQLQASGGTAPITWSATGLPPGLGINASSGLISGTPTSTGTFSVTATAADANSGTAQAAFTIAVAGSPPSISGSPAAATAGSAYSYQFTVGGNPSPTVTLTSGSLPPGISLSSGGQLSGTSTAAGSYSFTVTASNGVNPAAADTTTLTVSPGPVKTLTLSPASAGTSAGTAQSYTATGYDAYGNSLGDVTGQTTFTVAPDGSCAAASCSTTVAGPHTVTGTDGSAKASASLTVTAAAAAQVTVTGGDMQQATPNQAFSSPLAVRVTDAFGNPVAGAQVTFTVASGPASFPSSPATATTDGNGVATSPVLTAGAATGPVTVTAATGSATSATFVETVISTSSARADLQVTLAAPPTFTRGHAASVTLTITNKGPNTATSVLGGVLVTRGLTITSAGTGTVRGPVDLFTAPSLASGASVSYTLQVTAAASAPSRVLLYGAAVSGIRDPNYRNNLAVAMAQVP